jgi:TolA-binding protein
MTLETLSLAIREMADKNDWNADRLLEILDEFEEANNRVLNQAWQQTKILEQIIDQLNAKVERLSKLEQNLSDANGNIKALKSVLLVLLREELQ